MNFERPPPRHEIDIDLLARGRSAQGTLGAFSSTLDAQDCNFRNTLLSGTYRAMVAYLDGFRVGAITFTTSSTSKEITLTQICVLKAYRRQGIGKALMNAVSALGEVHNKKTVIVKPVVSIGDYAQFLRACDFEYVDFFSFRRSL